MACVLHGPLGLQSSTVRQPNGSHAWPNGRVSPPSGPAPAETFPARSAGLLCHFWTRLWGLFLRAHPCPQTPPILLPPPSHQCPPPSPPIPIPDFPPPHPKALLPGACPDAAPAAAPSGGSAAALGRSRPPAPAPARHGWEVCRHLVRVWLTQLPYLVPYLSPFY